MSGLLAIDPGASGGLAWTDSMGTHCAPMPETEGDVVDMVRAIKCAGVSTCYIERVGGYTGEGQPGSAMFKFGRGVGVLHGAMLALGVRVIEVAPQAWQQPLGLGTASGCASKADWKRKLKAEAQRRYPCVDGITLKTADALLILDYATRKENGQ